MNIRPSEQLDNAIFEVMNQKIPSTYTIDCSLSNAETGYEFDVIWFNKLQIAQDFANTYTDFYAVSAEYRPKDLFDVLNNYQNLTCTLILTPVDVKTFKDIEDRNPLIFNGRVIIDNPQDILKKYNIRQLMAEDEKNTPTEAHVAIRLPLSFQMMKQETYDLRRKEITASFTNTGMDQVISYITDQLGIKSTITKTADNPDKLKNLVIPPGHDLSSVFHYLQERYGVFGKGMRSYLCNGKLSIYPGFDTEASDYKTTMHVIKAPEKYIPGDDGYHTILDNEIYIVSTGPANITNMTESGVEKSGNVQVSMQADRSIEHVTNVKSDGKIEVRENTQTLGLSTTRLAQNTAINARYVGETVNAYNQTSNMSQYDCVMATVGWLHAEPILMNPGQKIIYHYDNEDGVYTTADGVLEGVSYTSTRLPERGIDKPFYAFGSQLTLRLKPDKRILSSS